MKLFIYLQAWCDINELNTLMTQRQAVANDFLIHKKISFLQIVYDFVLHALMLWG